MLSIQRQTAVLLCLFVCIGCGGPTKLTDGVTVKGKVLLPGGAALTGGSLILHPENGVFGAMAQIQPDGTFKLENAGKETIAKGRYQVFVRFSGADQSKFRTAVNQRYQQSTEDGESDVVVDIQESTDSLTIQLKR